MFRNDALFHLNRHQLYWMKLRDESMYLHFKWVRCMCIILLIILIIFLYNLIKVFVLSFDFLIFSRHIIIKITHFIPSVLCDWLYHNLSTFVREISQKKKLPMAFGQLSKFPSNLTRKPIFNFVQLVFIMQAIYCHTQRRLQT